MVFATVDLQPLQAGLGKKIEGILGYDFLSRFVVTVDYQSRTMTVTAPWAFHANASAQPLQIEFRGKWAFVKGELALTGPVTVQDSFMIDSGSGDAVDHPIVMKLQSRVPNKDRSWIRNRGRRSNRSSDIVSARQIRCSESYCELWRRYG